jgi:hypothetical protein
MSRTAAQQAVFDVEMNAFRAANDLPSDQTLWSVEQRQAYIQHGAAFVLSRPDIFDSEKSNRSDQTSIDFGEPSKAQPFRTFFSEFGTQAQRLNPFAEDNKFFGNTSMTLRFLSVAAAVAGAAYIVHLTINKK